MTSTAKLRAGTPQDAEECGRICYAAFGSIAGAHGFPSDFPAPELAVGLLSHLLSSPGCYSVVAEVDGEIVGSNFLDERSPIGGIGPITVLPALWDGGIGRALMEDVLHRCAEAGKVGSRLLQTSYHSRSLALYASLGFRVRDLAACLQGPPLAESVPGYQVRPATEADVADSASLCRVVHGHDRREEFAQAVEQGSALVVEHDGRISGYSTGLAFFGHSVGETNEDLKALIGSASGFGGPGLLVPTSNNELLRWCLANGLRIVELMTVMSMGLYNEPAGAYLPSVLY
jgi:GNAT superfamily N-acetyltransferase